MIIDPKNLDEPLTSEDDPLDPLFHSPDPRFGPTDPSVVGEIAARLERLYRPPATKDIFDETQRIGQCLGRYQLERHLATGSFGIVYQAFDLQRHRKVAVKIPRPEILAEGGRLSRFELEADTGLRLNHAHIVAVYETDLHSNPPYIVTEFCDGPSLAQWLERHDDVVAADEAAELIETLASAVQCAHDHGIVHRDLKPSNVLLSLATDSSSGNFNGYIPQLTDFGLARLIQPDIQLSSSSLILGTPLYMAPEQAESRLDEIGPATDVFALGAILYELLTRKPPFAATTYAQVIERLRYDQPVALQTSNPAVPGDLEAITLKCLQREMGARYATAEALAEDLRCFISGRPLRLVPSSMIDAVANDENPSAPPPIFDWRENNWKIDRNQDDFSSYDGLPSPSINQQWPTD